MTGLIETALAAGTDRLWMAAGVAAAFVGVCVASLAGRSKASGGGAAWLVVYASQTGQAEEIAVKTAGRLAAGGVDAVARALGKVSVENLRAAGRVLCVVSSTGDGEAPDNAGTFETQVMSRAADLAGKSFAVLALGDRNYERFCGFGHRVFDWFQASGAGAMAPCLEVDDLDPAVLAEWDRILTQWGAGAAGVSAVFPAWRLVERKRMNPEGSEPIYKVALVPEDGVLAWRAGDLAEIETVDGHRRDYSIASLPSEGRLELLVREVRTDGGYGKGSGLLIHGLEAGAGVGLRVKTHEGFHAPDGAGPVLMVAAGSGLAGLRPHILEALAAGRAVRVVYGERHPERDAGLCEELVQWRQAGKIALDLAFSQGDQRLYVQDLIGSEMAQWLDEGGAVVVCGGLDMGKGVEAALRKVCSEAWVDRAFAEGRYRRDLY